MNPLSTCEHTLNADLPMSKSERLKWLYLNWRNNARPQDDLDPSLTQRIFEATRHLGGWERAHSSASPARRLCDLFWTALPWPRLAAALGGEVRTMEVGCGDGRYGVLLRECLGGAFAGYLGLDVTPDPRWQELAADSRFTFAHAGSDDASRFVAGSNLIFTQSAIEHFDADLAFMRQMAEYVAATRHPVMQVHLMPSAAGLRTFMWHGVRNYTPRTISRMTRLFDARTHKTLYSLGAARCNRVHRRFITYPWLFGRGDRRLAAPAEYAREVHAAVTADAAAAPHGEACFYALVLLSGFAEDVLQSW